MKETLSFITTEHVVEDRLTRELLAQHADLHGRAARSQRAAMNRVEDG